MKLIAVIFVGTIWSITGFLIGGILICVLYGAFFGPMLLLQEFGVISVPHLRIWILEGTPYIGGVISIVTAIFAVAGALGLFKEPGGVKKDEQ